jgi:acetyl esterase/lipase
MSMLDQMFSNTHGNPAGGDTSTDSDMLKVIETFLDMNPQPLQTLTPEAARQQPTPADAVMTLLRESKQDRTADLGVRTEDITIPGPAGSLPARIYRMHDSDKPHPVVVYFHGGGWVIADINVYDAGPRAISKFGDMIVVSVGYRKAPEAPFPAAHNDAFEAYQWVRANAASFGGDPDRVAVMGESAGGNLAAGVAMMARERGVKQPIHMALIYPVAGIDMTTPSYIANAAAVPLNKPMMEWFVKHVFNDKADLQDPRINLVEADLKGLPPATIITAEIDPLCSEGELLAERLKAQGVEVGHKTFDGVTHEFFGMGLVVKDAAAAQTMVAHELKRAFGTALLSI